MRLDSLMAKPAKLPAQKSLPFRFSITAATPETRDLQYGDTPMSDKSKMSAGRTEEQLMYCENWRIRAQ